MINNINILINNIIYNIKHQKIGQDKQLYLNIIKNNYNYIS